MYYSYFLGTLRISVCLSHRSAHTESKHDTRSQGYAHAQDFWTANRTSSPGLSVLRHARGESWPCLVCVASSISLSWHKKMFKHYIASFILVLYGWVIFYNSFPLQSMICEMSDVQVLHWQSVLTSCLYSFRLFENCAPFWHRCDVGVTYVGVRRTAENTHRVRAYSCLCIMKVSYFRAAWSTVGRYALGRNVLTQEPRSATPSTTPHPFGILEIQLPLSDICGGVWEAEGGGG
jgi:hypothetical protein